MDKTNELLREHVEITLGMQYGSGDDIFMGQKVELYTVADIKGDILQMADDVLYDAGHEDVMIEEIQIGTGIGIRVMEQSQELTTARIHIKVDDDPEYASWKLPNGDSLKDLEKYSWEQLEGLEEAASQDEADDFTAAIDNIPSSENGQNL